MVKKCIFHATSAREIRKLSDVLPTNFIRLIRQPRFLSNINESTTELIPRLQPNQKYRPISAIISSIEQTLPNFQTSTSSPIKSLRLLLCFRFIEVRRLEERGL